MLNRQDSLLSSSRRQTPPPENRRRGKSVGCMSGIFQLISKYQSRTKRLTSGGKRGKLSEDSSPATKKVTVDGENNNEVTVERSPGLPPELRRGGSAENAKKTRPSALVVRLMGLEEKKCSPEGETLTEVKRKMLLKALDKCNQDLEALKKIIKAVESSSSSSASGASTPPPAAAVETCKKKSTVEHQLLSPISVLDEQMISRSPPLTKIHDNGKKVEKYGVKFDGVQMVSGGLVWMMVHEAEHELVFLNCDTAHIITDDDDDDTVKK